MIRLRLLGTLLSVTSLAACERNAVQSITAPVSGAFIRFQNYGVNAPGVNFYANEQKLTAISSASCSPPPAATDTAAVRRCATTGIEATTGVVYGNSASGGNYEMLSPGQYKLTGRVAATIDNGLPVSTVDAQLAEGNFYSYYISGIYNATTKTSDAFLIEDALPTSFDYTRSYVRIVNASANAGAISASSKLQGSADMVTLATGLAYRSASPFAIVAPGLTDLTVTVNGASVTFANQNFLGGHVLTLALRGDAISTSTITRLALTGSYNR